jgi:hypothetical protein
MIYYNKNDVLVRTIELNDVTIITEEERLQGWHVSEKISN